MIKASSIYYISEYLIHFSPNSLFKRQLSTVAIALGTMIFCLAGVAADLRVSIRSGDRPSLLFSENESIKINAWVEGSSGPVQLEYTARETSGEWMDSRILRISRKGGELAKIQLPLLLPGRGHYQLELTAKCGESTAHVSTTAAIVFTPRPTTIDSPWGIMYGVYQGFPPGLDPESRPACIAESLKMLGASWTRLNFWINMYSIEIKNGNVVLDLSRLRRQVDEFRKRGIYILGEIVQTPHALSSKPNSNATKGDGGPLYCRVKPANYRLWDQMVKEFVQEFKDDIQVWEIWNEVENAGQFWVGTEAEFIELIKHTSTAIRKGNPNAKIAAPGFTLGPQRCEPFFKAGLGKYIDILTVHYTSRRNRVNAFLKLEEKYGLDLPIENTEERAVIPINNLIYGIRTFKFIHMLDNKPTYIPLMGQDWKINPAGVTYSVGAYLIGTKKIRRTKDFPGFKVYFFGNGGDLAMISYHRKTAKLMESIFIDKIHVKTIPAGKKDVVSIDALGREKKIPGGVGEIPFSLRASIFNQNKDMVFADSECVFIRGCKDIVSIEGSNQNPTIVLEAENGKFDPTIVVSKDMDRSGGKYLNIFKKEAPGKNGYGIDLKANIPVEGDYLVYFSGNSLSRLKKPSSISPFYWSFDNGPKKQVGEKPLKILGGFDGAPDGMAELGTVHLTKGEHIFQLRLTAPREAPDHNWALWIDAIALIPAR